MRRTPFAVPAFATLLALATPTVLVACGPDGGVRSRRSDGLVVETTSTTAAAPSTLPPPVTTAPGTLPPTTVPPSTTAGTGAPDVPPPPDSGPPTDSTVPADTNPPDSTTTTPPPTPPATPPAVPGGWVEGSGPPDVLAPCCQIMWTGTPSPPVPADPSAPLPDGLYSATVAAPWSPSAPNQLTVELSRIELCSVLGADGCGFAGPYAPNDVSVAPEPVRTSTVTLDANVAVVLGGFDLCAAVTKTANGADLAALLREVDAAYAAAIAGPLSTGASEEEVLATFAQGPVHGFELADPQCMAGLLQFRSGDAPPLLLQTLTGLADDGSRPLLAATDMIRLVSVHQQAGRTTLGFYAGFMS